MVLRCETPRCIELGRAIPEPHALFVAQRDPNNRFSFHFVNHSTHGIAWVWDFGDGTPTVTDRHPDHVYAGEDEDGYYLVELTTTLPGGEQVTYSKLVSVVPIDPSFTQSVTGRTVELFANHGDTEVTYFWTFGDGWTSTERNPTHTYPFWHRDRVYRVTLTVTDLSGLIATSSQGVLIEDNPSLPTVSPRIWEDGCQALWEDGFDRLWETNITIVAPPPAPSGYVYELLTGEEYEQLVGGTYEFLVGASSA